MARYSVRGQCSVAATVTVYEEDGATLATIYDVLTGGSPVTGSVITADAQGQVVYYVESSTYPFMYLFNLLVEKAGYADIMVADVWSAFYAFSTAPSLFVSSAYGPLRKQIQRNWGRDSVEAQATIMFYFNAAQQFLARIFDAPELEAEKAITLTIDEDEYDIVADWSIADLRKIKSMTVVANTVGREIIYTPAKEWDQKVAPLIPNAASNIPHHYLEWASKLKLFPAPDAAYVLTLRYWREPTPITGDSSLVAYKEMDPVLVELVTGFCHISVEDVNLGLAHLKQAATLLKVFRKDAEFSKDFHVSVERNKITLGGEYWNDPFVIRVR